MEQSIRSADLPSDGTVEGFARVLAVADDAIWLEPEQTTSCGGCAAAARCGGGASGLGTVASRLEARRFRVAASSAAFALRPGDRVVIGIGQRSLVKAALLTYGLPLLFAIAAGSVAHGLYGDDLATLLGMSAGLAGGLLAAFLGARRLARRGELQPRLLRPACPGESCHPDPERP